MLKESKVWVVKIGSALLTHPKSGLNKEIIANLTRQIAELRTQGVAVVLVSSGSIAEGLHRLNIAQRPKELHKLQAAAATGQMGLIHSYEQAFNQHNIICAQVLLTHADLANRMRYLNARRTLQTLLEMDAVPIINENDTVVNDEIRFGDNDTLAALVANLVKADALVILTDQDGLFTADPSKDTSAILIHSDDAGDSKLEVMAGEGGELGTGGMVTKLYAAEKAARSGAITIITNGRNEHSLSSILNGDKIGTWLFPVQEKIAARKQWIAGHAKIDSQIVVDAGAAKALKQTGSSLLPIGVKAIKGQFTQGDVVLVVDEQGNEIGRGMVHYDAQAAQKIIGLASDKIESILGYADEPELIHRDNLVVY